MSAALLVLAGFVGTAMAGTTGSSPALGYVSDASGLLGRARIIDARAREACERLTVGGARCLPAADFLGPHDRLAGFRQIFWLLGTAGLSGSEHVVVVGDDAVERDFVAGMLHLCGQAKISILTVPVSQGAGLKPDQLGPGLARGMTRNPVYQGSAREDRIVLTAELAREVSSAHAPALLDGRTEAEYWGENIRALRGGHLPGAQLLPLAEARARLARATLDLPQAAAFVVYGNDPFESVAYFTLLRAGGVNARIFLNGWQDWANRPELPMDAMTYPERILAKREAAAPIVSRWPALLGVVNLAALLLVTAGLLRVARRRA